MTMAGDQFDEVVRSFLQEKLEIIKREFAPLQLIVFGSRARGQGAADSDIDLIVVSERFRDVRFPNRMGQFLNTVWPDVHVDALCYTPEEFDYLLHAQPPFVREAVANGIRIDISRHGNRREGARLGQEVID